MIRRFRALAGRARHGAWLVAIWVLLWGEPSAANVLSGIAVAGGLALAAPDPAPGAGVRVRALPLLRLGAHFARVLVASNLALVREVLRRRPASRSGTVVVPLPGAGEGTLTVVANLMALTPGTMPVGVATHPPSITIHVLVLDDEDRVRREAQHLLELVRATRRRPAAAT